MCSKEVVIIGLVISCICVTTVFANATCPQPSSEPSTCDPGEEFNVCNGKMSCSQCPHHQFQPYKNQVDDSCKDKNLCDGPHMFVAHPGDNKTDSTCGCEDGYTLTRYSPNTRYCEKSPPKSTFTDQIPTTPDTSPGTFTNEASSDYELSPDIWTIWAGPMVLAVMLPASVGSLAGYCAGKRKCRKVRSRREGRPPAGPTHEGSADGATQTYEQYQLLERGQLKWREADIESDAVLGGHGLVTSGSSNAQLVFDINTPNHHIALPGPAQGNVHQYGQQMPQAPAPGVAAAPVHAPAPAPAPVPTPPLAGSMVTSNNSNLEGDSHQNVSNVLQSQYVTQV